MANQDQRPGLLVLTTTYPRWQGDHEPPFVHELARRLTDRFAVTVLAPHAPGAQTQEHIDGVEVHRFRYAPERFERLAYDGGIPANLRRRPWLLALVPTFILAQLLAAYRLLRSHRPAVVHAHWLIPSGLVGAVLKELAPGRRPLLLTAHGADVNRAAGWPVRWLKRLAIESADIVTVVSRDLRDRIAPLVAPETAVEIAPMGVDLKSRFTPAAELVREPVLVFAGRLVEKKGVKDLLLAMPKVLARIPQARLIIAGHGPLADELRAMASHLDLDRAVRFVGSVPNAELPHVLRGARVAVLPFRTAEDGDVEGLGLVTLEAMGCGLPVIVGDVPAVHDIVEHGVNGWIVSAGAPDELADAITRLLENPALCGQLASRGRAFAMEHFDWLVISERYVEILLRCMGRTR